MEEKIRLDNPHKFHVGIITPDKPHGQDIAPGAFAYVTKDELEFLGATSTLLQRGILRVHEKTPEKKKEIENDLGLVTEDNANFMSDEDIKKKLSGNANQLKKWLDGVNAEPFVLDRIAEIAKGMNLAMNKIQILQDKVPKFEFIK